MKSPEKEHKRKASEKTERAKQFYESDEISRQLPGKKDYTIVRSIGKTQKKQKREMMMIVEEAHKVFQEKLPENLISRSQFAKIRPKHVISVTKARQNVCCCIYCENMSLFFATVKPYLSQPSEIMNMNSLLQLLICKDDSYNCGIGDCSDCKNFFGKASQMFLQNHFEDGINFLQWTRNEKTGFTEKKNSVDIKTVGDAFKWFECSFKSFKRHKFLVKVQRRSIDGQRDSLSDNEAMVIMDFSENFSSKSQNDVQQAFFGKNQIGLFTAVGWIGTKKKKATFIMANGDHTHSKQQVFYYMKLIVKELKEINPQLDYVRFVTDGAASQFKNRFILSTLLTAERDFGLKCQWDFFPTSHGKSPADGLGETIKRGVESRIFSGKFEVYFLKEFIECSKTFCKSTKLYSVSKEDTKSTYQELEIRWKKTKPMNGIRSLHHFKPSEDGKILIGAVTSQMDGTITFKNLK